MNRRRRQPQHTNHDRWLVSYADFITLMFAFFVVMFASSQVDKRKVGRLAREMQTAFSGREAVVVEEGAQITNTSTKPDFAGLQQELESTLRIQISNHSVSVTTRRDGLVISMREKGFFESGSAAAKPEAVQALELIADTLTARSNPLRIEGHTDDRPIHTGRFDSNWELSTSRATEIVKYFVVTRKFPPQRLSAAGFAEFHPVAGNDTAEGRSLNRRVDIVVLKMSTTPREKPNE